jgi:hypothetical protein
MRFSSPLIRLPKQFSELLLQEIPVFAIDTETESSAAWGIPCASTATPECTSGERRAHTRHWPNFSTNVIPNVWIQQVHQHTTQDADQSNQNANNDPVHITA